MLQPLQMISKVPSTVAGKHSCLPHDRHDTSGYPELVRATQTITCEHEQPILLVKAARIPMRANGDNLGHVCPPRSSGAVIGCVLGFA